MSLKLPGGRELKVHPHLTDHPNWKMMDDPSSFVGEKGVCNQAVLPLRVEPSDGAELDAQLNFGDFFTVRESKGGCLRVGRDFGNELFEGQPEMGGWIDTHLMPAMVLDSSGYERLRSAPMGFVASRSLVADADGDAPPLVLPLGSVLPDYKEEAGERTFEMNGVRYSVLDKDAKVYNGPADPTVDNLIEVLTEFQGAWYLWGGQTPLGADCSGFVQTVSRIFGAELPRNSSQQHTSFENIPLSEAKTGDLAYFGPKSGDRATHVGFLLKDESGRLGLFHSKQRVKLQWLEEFGDGEYNLMYPESELFADMKGVNRPIDFK